MSRELLDDPAVQDLMALVEDDQELERGRVVIDLTDGSIADSGPTLTRRLRRSDEIFDKFRVCATGTLSPTEMSAVIDGVLSLEEIDDLAPLATLLRGAS